MSDYVENPTAEDYARAAEHFLRQKEPGRAMEQVAAALTFEPGSPALLALFDRVVSASKAPLLLAPVSDGTFFGLVAARARILAKVGRVDEALHHLFQAVLFRPSVPYLPWALPWVEKRAAAKKVGAGALGLDAGAFLEKAEWSAEPGVAQNLEAAAELVRRVREATGAHALWSAEARLLEALGREAEAAERLRAAAEGTGAWQPWAALGAHHARAGALERAREAYVRARGLAPGEASIALDLGDACLEAGRLDEAREAYEGALAAEPGQPWARASLAFVGAVLGDAEPAALERAAREESPPGRATALLAELRAYEPEVPLPMDAVSRVLRRALERARSQAEPGPLRLRVRTSHPEPPSAHLAFRLGLARLGRAGSLEVVSDAPRGRAGPLDGLAPPTEATTAAIVRALAGAAAGALSPGELRAALAHPAALAADEDAPRWVLRWQLACAELLAASDEGRAALRELLAGPDDYSVAAAIVALARRGETEGFEALLERALARGDEPPAYAHALAWAWLREPRVPRERRAELFALARRSAR